LRWRPRLTPKFPAAGDHSGFFGRVEHDGILFLSTLELPRKLLIFLNFEEWTTIGAAGVFIGLRRSRRCYHRRPCRVGGASPAW
jgi:hypothetical protein